MQNKKISILITGANGFVGKNLTNYLAGKYNLLTPTRKQLDLLKEKDVANYFATNKIDVVIHTAVSGGERTDPIPTESFYQNLRMFYNIVKHEKHFKKMIFIGSGAEDGKQQQLIKVTEKDFDKALPTDAHGLYKYICSKYIENSDKIISLRGFGIFGKYEDYTLRFISNAICRNLLSLPITMQQDVRFDYIYVNDFVKIVEYFITNKCKYKFYNVGSGNPRLLSDIAKKINAISSKKSAIKIKKKGINNEYSCNISKLKNEIPALTFTDFDSSVKDLYLWYRSRISTIDPSKL
jgi:GDP-L-fucose synthase